MDNGRYSLIYRFNLPHICPVIVLLQHREEIINKHTSFQPLRRPPQSLPVCAQNSTPHPSQVNAAPPLSPPPLLLPNHTILAQHLNPPRPPRGNNGGHSDENGGGPHRAREAPPPAPVLPPLLPPVPALLLGGPRGEGGLPGAGGTRLLAREHPECAETGRELRGELCHEGLVPGDYYAVVA